MMKSSSGPPEHPATGSGRHFAVISPSYRTHHPEWTSVSPSALASSLNDHPELLPTPPQKKLCHLLNPLLRPPCTSSAQDVPEPRASSTRWGKSPSCNPSSAPHTYSFSLKSPSEIPQKGSFSAISQNGHAPSHLEFSDDREHGSDTYPAVTQPQPMSIDDDRISSSRPLKNTKRAAQNRAAQRAFRERKDRYVRQLEARSSQFEEYIVRYGLLEERERLLEAREAELMYRGNRSSSIQEISSGEKVLPDTGEDGSINSGLKASEKDRKAYITSLENELEHCRTEVARLRSELLKFHDQDEDITNGDHRVGDWETSKGSLTRPRTGSASDVDTSGPASCSPSSSRAWSTPKALTGAHHYTEWARKDRIVYNNNQKTSDEGQISRGANDNRKHSVADDIEIKRETIRIEKASRFGWSDGSRSPVSLSLSYRQKHPTSVKVLSEDCDPLTHHHLPTLNLDCHDVPLRRNNILERQGKLIRLPAIHHHLSRVCEDFDWKR